ncbi:NUDIX hydrolase [Paenibacillus piri]|uniref:NUDIX domain-containing protein n=1 Tax=Paenibacillus piri TaxID=2547395 RepID=A0A4R5KTA9_9BACL|nr:NUDIX domain-containing protein [Paenibacillus piri]TDF98130.1 NUDIX domain-containing protein [Paenibacillus piri]
MSQAEEYFDIYDEQLQPAGIAPRTEVHERGLWHHTFQCWIVDEQNGERALLFQKRHHAKDTFPGFLDISCAGHLLAGERIEDGKRELEEELGLSVSFGQLEPCGIFREEKRLENGWIDREVCHVFVYRCSQPLQDYRLQADEVTGLYRISFGDARRLAGGKLGSGKLHATGVETDEQGVLRPVEREFGAENFVPREPAYFEMMLKVADRDGNRSGACADSR